MSTSVALAPTCPYAGLPQQVAAWQAELPRVRRRLAAEAAELGRPRLWTDTLGALASTAWRVAQTAAPDAPVLLLGAAGAAVGLPLAPPDASAGALERAERLVRASGPAYIKLGQFIASARGLLPDAWVDAFAWCRDEAPPLAPGIAAAVVARELGPDSELAEMDDEPLAAGSIGQVHRGRLRDGSPVVVKVRRPGLRRRIVHDVAALALTAAGTEHVSQTARATNLTGFVELFAHLTLQELDFRLEALNLAESATAFADLGLDHVAVPRPLPGHVTQRVLVMEHVEGVSYARAHATLPADVLDGERLLRLAVRGVLETTLVHGLFHGDLHAGNVLVDERGDFALVDFGICGRFDDDGRRGLVRFLAAFAASDAAGQVEAMRHFGALTPDADVSALVADLQAELDVLERRERGEVTFDRLGATLGRLLQVMARNGLRLPTDLVLFFKNLLYLGEFCATFTPRADLLAEVTTVVGEVLAAHPEELGALLQD